MVTSPITPKGEYGDVYCKRQGDSEPSADGKLSHLLGI